MAERLPVSRLRPRPRVGVEDQEAQLRVRLLPSADLGHRRHPPAPNQAVARDLVLGRLSDGHSFQWHLRPAVAEAARDRVLSQRLDARRQASPRQGRSESPEGALSGRNRLRFSPRRADPANSGHADPMSRQMRPGDRQVQEVRERCKTLHVPLQPSAANPVVPRRPPRDPGRILHPRPPPGRTGAMRTSGRVRGIGPSIRSRKISRHVLRLSRPRSRLGGRRRFMTRSPQKEDAAQDGARARGAMPRPQSGYIQSFLSEQLEP